MITLDIWRTLLSNATACELNYINSTGIAAGFCFDATQRHLFIHSQMKHFAIYYMNELTTRSRCTKLKQRLITLMTFFYYLLFNYIL